ncbi:sensor histidine kinase [Luteimonas sp. e5]
MSQAVPAEPEDPRRDATPTAADGLERRLEILQRRQATLLQGISHDLRGPLRTIDAMAWRLQQAEPDAEASPLATRIRDSAARMGGLIDALLEYARIDPLGTRGDDVDIGFVADWAWMDAQVLRPAEGAQLEVQPGLQARGDESRLKQMLDKVFDNSLKFADPQRPLRVRIEGERDGAMLALRISDNGVGMELRDGQQPFAPFLRLHPESRGGGVGLGLAIAEAIVEQQGGSIHAESAPGQGTTLHLRLPAGTHED